MDTSTLILIFACLCGFFMAVGIGANDVANAMGTSVGSGAFTVKQAFVAAAIFECAGALLAGGDVAHTIRSDIIDASFFSHQPELFIAGMLSALLAAGTWLMLASSFGWPVSTTHTIIGAVIGFGLVAINSQAVQWDSVLTVFSSWIFTPIIAGVLAFLLFKSVQKLILDYTDHTTRAKRYIPGYMFLMCFVISLVTLNEGLKHVGLDLGFSTNVFIAIAISTTFTVFGAYLIRRLHNSEKMFGILMMFTACSMAFAHGSNDVANAIGPLAAIVNKLYPQNYAADIVPVWILALGAFGLTFGLVTLGYKVMTTIGHKITDLTPSRGFAAELATASTVIIASGSGLPISTTQTLVGAILGVGMARGIAALNLSVIRTIFMSWVITLPAGGVLSVGYFLLIRQFYG